MQLQLLCDRNKDGLGSMATARGRCIDTEAANGNFATRIKTAKSTCIRSTAHADIGFDLKLKIDVNMNVKRVARDVSTVALLCMQT